ncbi:MAG: hypothetical protein KGK16_17185 [Bradyrhizobium sp.]|nr:hypothetical protein [Bradyrhizobium sp.]
MTAYLISPGLAVLILIMVWGRMVVNDEIGGFVSRVGSLDGAGDPDAKNSD